MENSLENRQDTFSSKDLSENEVDIMETAVSSSSENEDEAVIQELPESDNEQDINVLLEKFLAQKKEVGKISLLPDSLPSMVVAAEYFKNDRVSTVRMNKSRTPVRKKWPDVQTQNKTHYDSSHATYSVVCCMDEGNALFSVPSVWLENPSANTTNCLWPLGSESQFNKAVEDMAPAEEEWDMVPVKILAQSRTLKGAKTKEKNYEDSINMEHLIKDFQKVSKAKASKNKPKPLDTLTIIRNKKKQIERMNASGMSRASTSREDFSNASTFCRTYGKRSQMDNDSDSDEITDIKRSKGSESRKLSQVPEPNSIAEIQDSLSRINAKLDFLIYHVQANPVSLQEQVGVSDSEGSLTLACELPLKDIESMQSFDRKLKDPELFKNMTKYLASLGGKNGPASTRKILAELVDNHFAKKMNWMGRFKLGHKKYKHGFQNYKKIIQLITASIQVNYDPIQFSVVDVEIAIKNWLRLAPWRNNTECSNAESSRLSNVDCNSTELKSEDKSFDSDSNVEKNGFIYY